ncbi:MAG TPA: glycoside hydrolase family 44 protein, partial [Rhodanobacteraceae bacterium]|nr:glycoside hydrolase family 44 protein [Rhodanobacteraceae bacterium]
MSYGIRNHLLACSALVAFMATAHAQNAPVTLNVDANANRHAISPLIYGVAYGSTAQLDDLNSPLNRYGGNNASRYNWQLNADNRDFDWYFESIADTSAVAGERGDTFISQSKAANAQAMLTLPMLDWVAKLGANRGKLASFSQAKYGAQTGNDAQWYPDAGNGVLRSTGQNITGNDPNDANVPNNTAMQQGWVQHLVTQWGNASGAGLKYYILDNEHSIWQSTHRDVHPVGATMDEILQRMIDYATMVKNVDPAATVVGPEEWGWSGYFYSGYDQQYGAAHNWCCYPDRAAHANWDYLPWLLDQMHQNEVATGRRLLDVFSVHWYPQGGEFGNDTSATMQQLRNRSTRSLWDPNYVDATWINDKVQLIPRIRNWVATYYPGLKTAITEYNWGAESHINGATTQADIYGIFGREGLDIAARWTTPDASTPTYKAMKIWRNYDGNKSAFGETSVSARAPNPDSLSAFAAIRAADGAMTVMVISKVLSGSTPVTVNLANFAATGSAQAWQLTSANAITRLSDINFSGSAFATSVPAQSITLYVIGAGGMANQPPVAAASATPTSGTVPLSVSFDGTGSNDPDGSIAGYAWTFGDGSSAAGISASHTYVGAGTYTATLTVTDNLGATGSKDVTITATADTNTINAPSATGVFARVGTTGANATTFPQSGVASGTYLFRVQAFNTTTGRVSAYSNQASV